MRNTFIRFSAGFISNANSNMNANNIAKCVLRCIDCKHSVKIPGHTLIECKAIAELEPTSGKIRFDNIIHARSMNGNCGVNARWFSPRLPYSRHVQK